MKEPIQQIPNHPLDKIALGCSGGGYRAASFHLGAMSYLNRLLFRGRPLLENVKLISTVSGGSITGVVYALKKQEGMTFEKFYEFLTGKLRTVDLVRLGIEKLNPGAKWDNPYKRKNLINAFAELYDREFTGGATFKIFDKMESHLEAVIFNSTEFNNSIDFRFRNRGTGIFGNFRIPVELKAAQEVKLADAIASSSCFTGGFEPIIWPGDFVHDNSPNLKALDGTSTPTGIMDGGIYDNQGIESMLLYKKDQPEPYFDLIIVSDVASPHMEPFIPYKDKPKKGIRNLRLKDIMKKASRINNLVNIILAAIIAVLALIPLLWGYPASLSSGICLGLSGAFLLFFIFRLILVIKIRKWIASFLDWVKGKIPAFFLESLMKLKIEELSIRRIEPLVIDRLRSVVMLTSTVFLKIVRRLNYGRLYENDLYRYRRVSNLIMELTEEDYNDRLKRMEHDKAAGTGHEGRILRNTDYMEEIGPEIKKVAEEAAGFGTTLWFTEKDKLDDMLDKLIATGQFTMCHNMLEYLEKLMFDDDNGYSGLDAETKSALEDLHGQCANDWREFRGKPMFLVK